MTKRLPRGLIVLLGGDRESEILLRDIVDKTENTTVTIKELQNYRFFLPAPGMENIENEIDQIKRTLSARFAQLDEINKRLDELQRMVSRNTLEDLSKKIDELRRTARASNLENLQNQIDILERTRR